MEQFDAKKQEEVKLRNSTTFNLFGEKKEIVIVDSFTNKGQSYEIDKSAKTCTCPAFQKSRNRSCKHLDMVFNRKPAPGMNDGPAHSLLKSSFQKAVRRTEPAIAVTNLKTMLESDVIDTLRRLLIVIPEDGLIIPEYAILVDMLKEVMKGGQLTAEDKDFIIQKVDEVARCPVRDAQYLFVRKHDLAKDYPKNVDEREEVYRNLSEQEILFVEAIRFRGMLGGMRGDMVMMKALYWLWIDRFENKALGLDDLYAAFSEYQSDLKYADVKLSEEQDVMIEGVDFHCSPLLKILIKKPYIHEMVEEFYPNSNMDVESRLKDLIWRKRSGICNKVDIIHGVEVDWFGNVRDVDLDAIDADELKYDEMYARIEKEVDNISRWFISKQRKG